MLETSARLLRLLSIMQSRRDWTGPELAARLQVTTRTVRNDVERLRQLGYPVDATPGVGGGYRLGTGAVLPPLLLDDEEAVAVAVGLRTAAGGPVTGIEEACVRALAKLQQLLPAALRRRVSALETFAVPAPAAGPVVAAATLTALAAACRDNRRIRFGYERHDGTASRRDVEPHRLVSAGRRWYLVAWDTGHRAWRTFRVDRVSLPAYPEGPRFTPRQLPDGDAALHVLKGTGAAMWLYRAEVIAHAPAADVIGRLPPAVTVDPIGEHTCRIHAGSDTPQMLALYLGMLGADFEIENPAEHPELVRHLRDLAARYGRAARGSPAERRRLSPVQFLAPIRAKIRGLAHIS
jgi:predicted DNA-binding transcriptional regulator YafY